MIWVDATLQRPGAATLMGNALAAVLHVDVWAIEVVDDMSQAQGKTVSCVIYEGDGFDISTLPLLRSGHCFADTPAEPRHAQATNAEKRMDHTRSIIRNSARSAAIETLPFLLTGSIHLNLSELLLQAVLYRLAFLQRGAEIVEACIRRRCDSMIAISRRSDTTSISTISAQTFILNCVIQK
jgi:hypothetical protein